MRQCFTGFTGCQRTEEIQSSGIWVRWQKEASYWLYCKSGDLLPRLHSQRLRRTGQARNDKMENYVHKAGGLTRILLTCSQYEREQT